MKKLFIVNNSEPTTLLIEALNDPICDLKYYEFDFKKHINNDSFAFNLNNKDIENFLNSDGIVIFGTWGSIHHDRHISNLNVSRQASLDHINRIFVTLAKEYNIPVIVFETATLSRCRFNYIDTHFDQTSKGLYPKYYRLSRDHWTWGKGKWLSAVNRDENRLKYFRKLFKSNYGIDLPVFDHYWKNSIHGSVLICAGLENDPTSSMPVLDWIEKTVDQVRSQVNRKVRIRLHPKSSLDVTHLLDKNIKLDNNTVPLRKSVNDIYCAILDSSTSIFELVDLGIPVITSTNSFGRELGNTNIDQIDSLNYADQGTIAVWYNQMAWTEFHATEIQSGKILPYIKELLK